MRVSLFLTAVAEITHTVHQFLNVFLPAHVLRRTVLINLRHDSRTFHQFHTQRIGILLTSQSNEFRNQVAESLQLGISSFIQLHSVAQWFTKHFPQAHFTTSGRLGQLAQSGIPDSSCRIVDDTLESLFIVRIHRQTEIGHHILHFFPLIKRESSINTVRYAALAQCLLKNTALCIRTVKDGKIMIGISRLGMQLRNLVGHDFSFFHVAISCKHADRFPLVFLGEHLLLNLVAVFGNQAVRRIHDGLRGAVILLQLEQPCIFVCTGKIQDIINVGSTERIDTLGIITYHTHKLVFLRKLEYDAVLCKIRILILIY